MIIDLFKIFLVRFPSGGIDVLVTLASTLFKLAAVVFSAENRILPATTKVLSILTKTLLPAFIFADSLGLTGFTEVLSVSFM